MGEKCPEAEPRDSSPTQDLDSCSQNSIEGFQEQCGVEMLKGLVSVLYDSWWLCQAISEAYGDPPEGGLTTASSES